MRDHSKRYRRTVALAIGLPFAFAGGAVAATADAPADPPITVAAPEVADGTAAPTTEETAASTDDAAPPPPTTAAEPGTSPDGSSPPSATDPSTTAGETSTTTADPSTTPPDTSAPDTTTPGPGTTAPSTTAPDSTTTSTVAEPVVVDIAGTVATASGAAVAEAWVQVTVGDRAPVTALTDATGAFTVAVPEGPAILRLESAGTPALPLSWAIGPVGVELAADVVASFTVPDPVVLAVTALDGTSGSDGGPFAGATVGVANRRPVVSEPFELAPGLVVTAESYPWAATTGADGTAALALFATAEPVTVFAAVPGPDGVPNIATAVVDSVLESRSLAISLGVPVPPVQYTGVVRSADGRPIPNVWVHLGGVPGVAAATSTDSTGRFALDVPAGAFTLSLISGGTPEFPYSFTVGDVELDLATDTDHELVVPDPVSIRVAVTSSTGRPWADAYAGLDDYHAPRSIPFELLPGVSATATSYPWSASSAPDGVARLQLLPSEGPLRLYAARVSEAGVPSVGVIEGVDGRDDRRVEITLD